MGKFKRKSAKKSKIIERTPIPVVVDEWLFHYLNGSMGKDKQEEAVRFVYRLLKICDKIVISNNGKFIEKFNEFIKNSGINPLVRGISQVLKTSIIKNSKKTVILKKDQIRKLSDELLRITPTDDCYLLEQHISVKGSFILTTDGRLKDKFLSRKGIDIRLVDGFMRSYLS